MALLEWKPDFALGIPAVDHEHREMIDLINQCHERLDAEPDAEAVEGFLGEIHAGIAAHFALEETIMRRAGYPEFAEHKADHEALLDQIRGLMDSYAADPQGGEALLRARLGGWFSAHFASYDARLHRRLPGAHA